MDVELEFVNHGTSVVYQAESVVHVEGGDPSLFVVHRVYFTQPCALVYLVCDPVTGEIVTFIDEDSVKTYIGLCGPKEDDGH